jgi:GTPase SAR1 family protein
MVARSCEINVALLGNVSAGKTTVLNALFRDKLGEVAMKRTTVGANYFHIYTKNHSTTACVTDGTYANADEDIAIRTESDNSVDNKRSAKSILKEITEDNIRIRENNGESVQEKHFDVELEGKLIPMIRDAILVLIDIPGINEAGTDNKYKEYVSKKWHTFDCVILVMDGKHDGTDDQMFLLEFVKHNLATKKVPIIILYNKIDYFSEVQEDLIRIAREQVEDIFDVTDCEKELQSIMSKEKNCNQTLAEIQSLSPIFISISAVEAYIFQTAPQMNFDQFKNLDNSLIEEFGRGLDGRVIWWKLSDEEKVRKVYDIVHDASYCQRGLKECNFDKFLFVLNYFLGGEELQNNIIQEHKNVAINLLHAGRDKTDITS